MGFWLLAHSLCLKLVGSEDVGQRHYFLPVDRQQVLWDVLKQTRNKTTILSNSREVFIMCINGDHRQGNMQLFLPLKNSVFDHWVGNYYSIRFCRTCSLSFTFTLESAIQYLPWRLGLPWQDRTLWGRKKKKENFDLNSNRKLITFYKIHFPFIKKQTKKTQKRYFCLLGSSLARQNAPCYVQ